MGIGMAGMEGIPGAPPMLGMGGIPGVDGMFGIGGLDGMGGTLEPAPACACIFGIGGIPAVLGIFGMTGRGGIGGMTGAVCVCGPTPGGGAGILGMVGIGGATGVDCGPMPGGNPPGGNGIPGIPGAPTLEASVADFRCTKLRLFGKSSVSVPELMSRMSTGFGQLVAVISTRNEVVPTVYSKALVWLPWIMTALMRPSKATAVDARAVKQPTVIGRIRWKLVAKYMANSGHVVWVGDVAVPRAA